MNGMDTLIDFPSSWVRHGHTCNAGPFVMNECTCTFYLLPMSKVTLFKSMSDGRCVLPNTQGKVIDFAPSPGLTESAEKRGKYQ